MFSHLEYPGCIQEPSFYRFPESWSIVLYFSDFVFCFVFLLQPGSSLEQTHIFVLAHILRRPIIVYGVKYYKSFRGETLGYTRFQGEQEITFRSNIVRGCAKHHSTGRRTRLPL